MHVTAIFSAQSTHSNRLIVLNQGQVVANGEPRAVMSEPAVVAAYLGTEHA